MCRYEFADPSQRTWVTSWHVYYDTDEIFTSFYRHLTSRMTRSFFFTCALPVPRKCLSAKITVHLCCRPESKGESLQLFSEITKSLFALRLLKDDRGKSIKKSRDLLTFLSFEVRRVCFLYELSWACLN